MKEKLSSLKTKFLELRKQREEGKLSEAEFLAQVQDGAVEDEAAAGRWWNINPDNGRWIYYDGKSWVERTPQGFEPSAVPPAPPETKKPQPPAPPAEVKPAKKGRPWLWAAIIVIGVAVVAGGIWGIWLLTQQPRYAGGDGGGDRDPVRDLLNDFYGTYSRGDYDGIDRFLEIKRPTPAALSGQDLERQKTTIADIEMLGEFVGQYIMDFHFEGAPKAADIEELLDIFVETEINHNRSFNKDGWGNPILYEADVTVGSMTYTITSFGSDGMKGPDPQEPGVVRRAEEDLIWADGTWVQKTEGFPNREESRYQRTWREAGIPTLSEGFTYRIGEVKTEGKNSNAMMILTIDGKQYEQQVSMLNDFGAGWRIVSVGRALLLPEQPRQEEATTGLPGAFGTEAVAGGDEQEVRRDMETFLAAFKAVDIPGIKELLTGEALEDFERSMDYLLENEEELAQAREESAKAVYEIVNIKLDPENNKAEVLLKIIRRPDSPSPEYYLARLRLEAGRWKIYNQGRAEAERPEEEAPEYETPEDEDIVTEIPQIRIDEPEPDSPYILVAGDIVRPDFIPGGPKVYPQRARMLKKNGYVMLEVKISKTGETVSVNILDEQPPDFGFGDAAKQYFEQGSWKPAKKDGEPINAIFRFRFDYVLQ